MCLKCGGFSTICFHFVFLSIWRLSGLFPSFSLSLIIWQRSLSLSCILCFIKSAMSTILYMIFIIIGNNIYRDIKHQTPLFMLLVYPCYPVSDIKILFSRTKMCLTTAKADTKSFFMNCNFVCVCCISISSLHWLVFFCIFVNFVKHLLTSTTKRKWER